MDSLYRYMKLKYLFDLIDNARLPMINPQEWEDKNDLYAVNESSKDNEIVGICCLTSSRKNSIYRWSKMSQNGICVRVKFDEKKIKKLLNDRDEFRMKPVRYFNLKKT